MSIGEISTKDERFWYVLYTRARCEKKVTMRLNEIDIKSFLPMQKVLRIWSDRKKYLEQPLFPSYVFVFANAKERYQSLTPYGVVRMVSFCGKPAVIPNSQIEAVSRILRNGFKPQPGQHFTAGAKVEIVEGPLRGLVGYLIQIRKQNRFLVNIDTIRQSLAVEIDSVNVRRIGA